MQQFKNFSSWREEKVTVQAGECHTLAFIDTKPNMFYIQNPNSVKLRIGISKLPTSKNYEFTIDENSSQTIGRPTATGYLYILNTGSVPVDIVVFSIYDTFDLNVLKNLNVQVDGATFEADGIVRGFEAGASIPTGSNTIGLVGLRAEEKAIISEINQRLYDYYTEIGNDTSNLDGMASNLDGMLEAIKVIRSQFVGQFTAGSNTVDRMGAIVSSLATANELLSKITNVSVDVSSPTYLNNVEEFTYEASDICKVHFSWLMFDGSGTADIVRCTPSADGNSYIEQTLFTMLEGEQFTDMEIELNAGQWLEIQSDNPLYRIKYYVY